MGHPPSRCVHPSIEKTFHENLGLLCPPRFLYSCAMPLTLIATDEIVEVPPLIVLVRNVQI